MQYKEFEDTFENLVNELNRLAETSAILANIARFSSDTQQLNNDAGGDYAAALEMVASNLRQLFEKQVSLVGEVQRHKIVWEK